mmetsp:Transcript_3234/g.4262  ORF Transcript_3234/g.4262 Transcript_3234/m.4262 type:complete len:324 (+) Transcript_3234:140-1111(+)
MESAAKVLKREHIKYALLLMTTVIFIAGGEFGWSQQRALLAAEGYLPLLRASSQQSLPYQKSGTVYGHVHIAKTSGSNLNGMMSVRYSHVCGNKGYSYDAYQHNKRLQEARDTHNDALRNDIYREVGSPDPNARLDFNRGRIPQPFVKEIGFEDCDWISWEGSWKDWVEIASGPYPLELHIPCRDPVDHLMSQCNHLSRQFDCQAADIRAEIDNCIVAIPERFNKKLEQDDNNINLKCFDFRSNDKYLEFMDGKVENRNIPIEYPNRQSNAPRDKEKECIWSDPATKDFVWSYLLETYDYYDFCHRCMHSENDLFDGPLAEPL